MTTSNAQSDEDRLLERVYRLSGGDTHKPVDLQNAGRDLELSTEQMLRLLCSLVEQSYLVPSQEPDGVVLFLTEKAIKKLASARTRR